jgi:hypothetical protein
VAELTTSIYRSIELREYNKLETLAREVIPGWNISVRSGPLRDALIRLLGLEIIIGLDCDYLGTFNQIESNDLIEVRNQAFTIAIDLLREQIERRNTFFFDTDAFSTTPYAIFVKDIISARTAELEELPSKPSLREVYSTFYGFEILSSGRISSYHAGASEKGIKCIEDLAAQFGKQTKLNARIFQPSRKAFANCTSETKRLLWNILRMFNGGWDTRSNAAKNLGMIGDSRATHYIITNLQNTTNHYGKPALLKALGAIGDPKGLDIVLECLDNSRLRRVAILSLGGICHPNTLQKLIQIKESNNRHDLGSILTAIGTTRSIKALDFLSSLLTSRNGRIVQKGVEALCSIGTEGLERITKDSSKLVGVFKRSSTLHKMIRLLKRIPKFQWTSELQRKVAQTISRTGNICRIINELYTIPELAESTIIIDAILKHIEKKGRYRWNQWYMRRLLQGGKIQRLLAKAIRMSEYPQNLIRIISNHPELEAQYEIKQAIKFVKNRDVSLRPPAIRQKDSLKRVIAKQKSSPKKSTTVQQSLLAYLESLIKLDIEHSKKHGDTKRLRK